MGDKEYQQPKDNQDVDMRLTGFRIGGEHERLDSDKLLPEDFRPGNWDVICQRGRNNSNHSKFSK